MARTVDEINSYLVSAFVSNMAAIGVTIQPLLWSKRNMFRSAIYSVAVGQALLEQLMDLYQVRIEGIVSTSAAASFKWVQKKMLEFQYSDTNPQVVILRDTIPVYSTIDATLRIITACSVTSDVSNTVSVKVAKGNPLQALSGAEKASAQGYINTIGVAGIDYVVLSAQADKLYIDADIYYQGQYASVIQSSVIEVIKAFLQNRSLEVFDGSLKMSDLENIIRQAPGVVDVVLNNVRGRADIDTFNAGIDLISNNAVIIRQWKTVAGYILPETTATKTFADTLTFIAE